jgi:hypothetical protein
VTFDIHTLASEEVEAALVLGAGHSVSVRVEARDVDRFRAHGFVEAPDAIECFVRCPFDASRLTHRHRNHARSRKEWRRRGLSLELLRMDAFGFDTFLEHVYWPVFVPQLYGRGIGPHMTHELDGLRRVAGPDAIVAIIRDGERAIVGAALLHEGAALRQRDCVVAGDTPAEFAEGLVYAIDPRYGECKRALIVELAAAYAGVGRSWLSLGRDLVWCEDAYSAVLLEKLGLADAIVARFGSRRHMVSFRPQPHEDALLFEGTSHDERVSVRAHACDAERTTRIEALVGRASPPPRAASLYDRGFFVGDAQHE